MLRSFYVHHEPSPFIIEGIAVDDPYFCSIGGYFEKKFQLFCSEFLLSDAVSIDIGANIGITSIILSQFSEHGKIFALEPSSSNYEVLKRNIHRNHVSNIIPINCAVNDKTGSVAFKEISAIGHIDRGVKAGKKIVSAYSFDDLVAELNLSRLDFIKVDIEVFEPQFFRGAKRTIEKFNPIIYFELNSWCLIAHGYNNPIEFLSEIIEKFDSCFRVEMREDLLKLVDVYDIPSCLQYGLKPPPLLAANTKASPIEVAQNIVHENIVKFGSVNDLVIGPLSERIGAWNVGSLKADLDTSIKSNPCQVSGCLKNDPTISQVEFDMLEAENQELKKRIVDILNSRSWVITKPIRKLGSLFLKMRR